MSSAKINHHKIPVMLEQFQNPNKVFHHADRIVDIMKMGDTHPVHLTIGFTNYCNHKCSWCYINWNQAGKLSDRSGTTNPRVPKAVNASSRLIEAVGEAKRMGLKSVTIVGDGEPTMHPKFIEMLSSLYKLKLDIGIYTNLSTKNPEVLQSLIDNCFFIRGSVDAARAEVHEKMHGTDDFNLVIENIKHLIRMRNSDKTPAIGIQYVVNHHNCDDLPYAAKFYRDLGVDYLTIKPAYKNILNPSHEENKLTSEYLLPLLRQAKTFEADGYSVFIKESQFYESLDFVNNDARYYKKCYATPLSPYLDEDGSVEMCGNLKGRGFTMGNINEQSFSEIWSSEKRRGCIDKIDLYKCPAGCRLDPLNKVLWDAINPDDSTIHKNFL